MTRRCLCGQLIDDIKFLCRECIAASSALPPVRSEPLFSVSRFRSVLIRHGIIFPEAIHDAEGFDGERTLAATRAAYDELMENAAVEARRNAVASDGLCAVSDSEGGDR